MLRDPRYLLPLGLLVAVTMLSFMLGRGDTHAQSSAPKHAPVATAAANVTPDDTSVDARRASDLQRLSNALGEYRQRNNTYPSTRNAITQICARDADAGCALKAIAADLRFSDGDEPYYYASDGARFVLMARAKVGGDGRACPVGLPAELAAGAVICMTSEQVKN